jgi:hypothetical protein
MRRREFIFALGGGLVCPPLAAHAQKKTVPMIGYLGYASPEPNRPYTATFIRALAEAGFTEDRDCAGLFKALSKWPRETSPARQVAPQRLLAPPKG